MDFAEVCWDTPDSEGKEAEDFPRLPSAFWVHVKSQGILGKNNAK